MTVPRFPDAARRRASSALHERVQAFAAASLSGARGEPFERIAEAIGEFQGRFSDVHARLRRVEPPVPRLHGAPLVVADSLRRVRVAAHPPDEDCVVFRTSGTTGVRGQHPLRTLDTYAALCVDWGRRFLAPHGPVTVICLASPFEPDRSSSLAYMMERFAVELDGRALEGDAPLSRAPGGILSRRERLRFPLTDQGIDLVALRAGIGRAAARREPVLLLSTSFALVWLLEQLNREAPGTGASAGQATLRLPPGSRVMQTGGFKGKSVEVPAARLRTELARRLGIEERRIVSEYGMTELGSQLYDEGGGPLGPHGGHVYREPPWLRTHVLDAESLEPVAHGAPGLACFVDLCNVDSALVILTQDLVRRVEHGLELLGRRPSATLRGCSLAVEERPAFLSAGGPLLARRGAESSPRRGTRGQRASFAPGGSPGAHGEARERLARLQAAASSLVGPESRQRAGLIERLAQSTGLPAVSVAAALDECLELQPTEPERLSLLEAAGTALRAHVILPARVFVSAYRAIALALAAAPTVFVRPSRREPELSRALWEAAGGLFHLVERIEPMAGDQVWVYGSDQTLLQLARQWPSGVDLRAFGSGYGIAVVDLASSASELCRAQRGIARDAARFEQQGCLSPRLVFCLGTQQATDGFARGLCEALREVSEQWPVGRLSRVDREDARSYRASAAAFGLLAVGDWGSVCVAPSATHLAELRDVPPPGRNLELRTLGSLRPLGELSPWVIAASCSRSLREELSERLPRARITDFGEMQRPPFDGPVDRRGFFEGGA